MRMNGASFLFFLFIFSRNNLKSLPLKKKTTHSECKNLENTLSLHQSDNKVLTDI